MKKKAPRFRKARPGRSARRRASRTPSSARGFDASTFQAIRRNSIFAGVHAKDVARVLPRLTLHQYNPGEIIFDESTRGRYLYLLLRGRVRIEKNTRHGIESLLAVLHEGDFFGELSMLDGLPRSARAEAADPTTIAALSAGEMRQLTTHSNALTFNLLKNVALRLRTMDQAFVRELDRNALSGKAKLDRLNLLIEASRTVNSTIDIDKLLILILTAASDSIHAERGTLYLLDREKGELWAKAAQGNDVKEIRLPIGKGLAGYVAKTGEVVNIADAYNDPRFNPEIDRRSGYRTHNVLCMPMRNKEAEIVGVFQFLNKKHGKFTDDDASFIDALSIHAAIALENARLVQEMMKTERLSAVGRMAGTIIHDIKNPMSVIRMYAQLIQRRASDGEVGHFAQEVIRQVDRFVKMTQEILDYSSGVSELNIETVQLQEVLDASLKFIEVDFKEKNIAISKDFRYTGTCRLDPEKITRVLYNIAGNAADAMPKGGTLTIRTECVDETLHITLSDTGKGIPESVKARVFEPFFTHGKRHGTGLGLAIVKKIIEDHGGKIEIDSTENVGTSIHLRLHLQ
jgi:signal transduction histidine kinase/CRP-like cAMP-binding protein